MSGTRLSRRDFMRISALAAAGTALAGCGPSPTAQVIKETVEVPVLETVVVEATAEPTAEPAPEGPVTIIVMYVGEDLSEEQRAEFEAENPNIKIEFIEQEGTRFQAMLAAGQAPYVYRSGANLLPGEILRGIAGNVQPFVDVSTLITEDDLAPCHDMLRRTVGGSGVGDLYAIAKDWSPDFSLWINTEAFEEMGIPIPSDDKPLTYTAVGEMALALTKREGERTLRWGLGSAALAGWAWTAALLSALASLGQTLYDDTFSKMILVDNPDAVEFIKYWVDLSLEKAVPNPLDPVPTWDGGEFTKGTIAIQQYGYWFSAMAESDVTAGKVRMLPAPIWGPTRINPCAAATCTVMTTQAKAPDATWRFIEWFSAGSPGVARAKSGWGVPALKSQYPLMPNQTLYQQQVQKVLAMEMEASSPGIVYNPFYDAASTAGGVWNPGWEKVLLDEITFDEFIQMIEDAHNEAILEGIERATG